jgi:hypothetical protein
VDRNLSKAERLAPHRKFDNARRFFACLKAADCCLDCARQYSLNAQARDIIFRAAASCSVKQQKRC